MKKQIKHIRIDIDTAGAKEAEAAIAGINKELDSVQGSAKAIGGYLKGPTKALETLYSRAKTLSSSFGDASKAAGSMNTALNGNTKKAEKGLSGYLDNLDMLTMSLKEVSAQSSAVSRNLASIGDTMGTSRASSELEGISASLHGILAEMQELNIGSRITTGRLKDVREAVSDVGVSANRTDEELQGMNARAKSAGAGMGGLGAQTVKTDNALKNFNKGTGSSTARSFSKMAFDTNYLTLLYAKLAINIYAISEAFRFLGEAANLQRLMDASASFTSGVSGLNISKLAADMNEFSGSILSVKESMEFATKGAAFEFTADQLTKLAAGARKASIALGVNFTDAMDRVLRGISKQEIELFDELGIVTRLTPAYKAYAESINKTIAELSDYERQLALTNEVQKQLDDRFASIKAEATPYEKLATSTKNFTDALLISIAKGLGPMAEGLAELLSIADPLGDKTKQMSDSMETMFETMQGDSLGIMTTAYSELADIIDGTTIAVEEATKAHETSLTTYEAVALGLGVITVAVVALAFAISPIAGPVGMLGKAMASLTIVVTRLAAGLRILTMAAMMNPFTAIALGIALAATAILAFNTINDDSAKISDKVTAARMKQAKAEEALARAKLGLEDKGVNVNAVELKAEQEYQVKLQNIISKRTALWVAFNKGRMTAEKKAIYEKRLANSLAQQESLGSLTQFVNKAMAIEAAGYKATEKAIVKGASDLSTFAQKASLGKSSFSPAIDAITKVVNIAKNVDGTEISYLATKAQEEFDQLRKNFESNGLIPWSTEIQNATQLREAILELHKATKLVSHVRARDAIEQATLGSNEVEVLSAKLVAQAKFVALHGKVGGVAKENLDIERKKLDILGLTLVKVGAVFNMQLKLDELNHKAVLANVAMEGYYEAQSSSLERQAKVVEETFQVRKAQEGLGAEAIARLELTRDREIEILGIKIDQTKQAEAQAIAEGRLAAAQASRMHGESRDIAITTALGQDTAVGGNLKAQADLEDKIAVQQLKLDGLNAEGSIAGSTVGSDMEILAASVALQGVNTQLGITKELMGLAKVEDFANKVQSVKDLMGDWDMTGLQTQFANTFDTVTESVGKMTEAFKLSKEGFKDASFLDGLSFGFGNLGDAITGTLDRTDASAVASMEGAVESLSSIGQMGMSIFQELSAGKVAGYDREIAAEKRKDGASVESLAKIKKLEAKKIKEEAKAKKASVIMSTAMAVMQGFAQLGPIGGAIMAVPMIAMGAMQMSNIDKAAGGQMAALGGGESSMSITGGTKDNSADVSKAASAGEYAFMSGQSGSGNSGNFTTPGRAGGGYSEAGTSITVGESGPEVITPAVPVNVTSSGNSKGNGGGLTFAPVFNASAVDASGMEELFQNYSRELYDGLQRELAANNQTLESL